MPKLTLEDNTKAFLTSCLDEGRMVLPEPHKLDLSNGAIVVACADGHQMGHLWGQLERLCTSQALDPCIHLLTVHGGGMILSPEWPDQSDDARIEAEMLRKRIGKAQEIKHISTVLLLGHAPCGAVCGCGLDVETSIRHLVAAKKRLKNQSNGTIFRCFLQVDWQRPAPSTLKQKELYFIPAEKWVSQPR